MTKKKVLKDWSLAAATLSGIVVGIVEFPLATY
jgi:hypothetical protein